MKLYNSVGPNPHVVRMFAAEKGLTLPMVDVDLRAGENRKPPYQDKVNVAGQTPALELADGAVISEITVICEYLEEKHPTPSLIGTTPEERAETRMWTRRIDLNICEPLANGFRAAEGRPMFEPRMKLVGAEGAAELKAIARDRILWLDGQIAGRDWIVPGRFSLADILLFCFLGFGAMVGQPLPEEAGNIKAWFERVKARPSAAA
ncbi:glutathione S-transferase family protein [Phenylobacterium aquaticum]|uniref:glutathione S-transferase family protein n=1 Tax=Phenylobacterium aquaticum TaxID=1763816 RepID=UPI001F5CD65D|nr:glutathione S-transferase family protein [Phenylobacterium aquaticum]MCI3131060.1 glutathione S-transferase family protein [Phenylobacterium aquaticum]